MSRSHCTFQTPSRLLSAHASSSAFSSSANPDEDWTKISDLAERRRIQNRIAQRNYPDYHGEGAGKKLKRRLEDLEKRAESTSLSPPESHAELKKDQPNIGEMNGSQSSQSPEPSLLPSQLPSPVFSHHFASSPLEEHLTSFPLSSFEEREPSMTPPPQSLPLLEYRSQYPRHDELIYPSFTQSSQHYRLLPTGQPDNFVDYLLPVPVPLPSIPLPSLMNFDQNIKQENDNISQYNANFQELSAVGMPRTHSYRDSNSMASPLESVYYEEPIIFSPEHGY